MISFMMFVGDRRLARVEARSRRARARASATESAVTSQMARPSTRTAWARGLSRRPLAGRQGRSLSRAPSPAADVVVLDQQLAAARATRPGAPLPSNNALPLLAP